MHVHPIHPNHLSRACAALLLSAAGVGHAHNFCVTDSAELQQALTDSSDGGMYNGEDNTVELSQGFYQTGAATQNGPFHYSSTAATGDIIFRGGYGSNCFGLAPNATRAILDGGNSTQVLAIYNQNANIGVGQLTVRNGEATVNGAGISAISGGTLSLSSVIIEYNHTTAKGGGFYLLSNVPAPDDKYLILDTSLVLGNSADKDAGAGIMSATNAGTSITRNTIYGNTTLGSGSGSTNTGGVYIGSPTAISVVDNIIRGNTQYGAWLAGPGNVSWNDYGAIGGVTPTSSTGNIDVVPGFVDAAARNFHLAGDSPLLRYSPQALGGSVDIEGHRYPTKGGADIGAYCETIFGDGFDPY